MNGRRLFFDEEGIFNGVFVMRDRQTRTLWSHYTGEALTGPLRGETLRWVQVERGDRSDFEGKGLTSPNRKHLTFRPLPDLSGNVLPRDFVPTLPADMGELAYHEKGLGAAYGKKKRFYPLEKLYSEQVVNDGLAVVMVHEGSATGAAYSRCLDGTIYTFVKGDELGSMVDRQTGSVWDRSGRAVSGPLEGRQLTNIRSMTTDWYGWKAYFPQSTVY